MIENDYNELRKLLLLELDEIYPLLIPEDDMNLYSKGGAVAKGKNIFKDTIPYLMEKICKVYRNQAATSTNLIDLAVLITSALTGLKTVANIPILPLSAIIVKIGLDNICIK